jgi:hypothetical protein
MGAFLFPTNSMAQTDTLLAMPESAVSANPNVASARLKSNYFLAESKFQEEAFYEAQQLFQKLIDSAQKNATIIGATKASSLNNDAQFISGAYFRLSQLSAIDYPTYPQSIPNVPKNSEIASTSNPSNTNNTNEKPATSIHKASIHMALYQLELALKYSPNNKDYLFAEAQLLEKSKNWLGAIKIYTELCTIDPHSWTFHEKAASAYFEYLPQILNGKGGHYPREVKPQVDILKEFQAFADTWEKHFSLSPSIVETKLYILWCKEVYLKFPADIIDNPEKNTSILQHFQSMIPINISNWMMQNEFTNNTYQLRKLNKNQPTIITPSEGLMGEIQYPSGEIKMADSNQHTLDPKTTLQQRFKMAITKQDWLNAYQFADSLENSLPIFTARDLVKGFQELSISQYSSAVEICRNSAIENNPFIIQLYMLLEAKAMTQMAKTHANEEGKITSVQMTELTHAFELWQKLFDQKALTHLNDINDAKSVAMKLDNQEWIDRFQQLASDLNNSPSNPK